MEQKHFTVESIDITSKNIDKCLELLEKDSTNDEVVGIIYKTNNLDKFQFAVWNRDVNPYSVNKIKKSMNENGNLLMPICVNEKLEIIDGQTRVSAEKELGLSAYYYIVNGMGRSECVTLNKNQTNWKMIDYIKSYDSNGNPNYSLLINAWNEINHVIPIEVLASILNDRLEVKSDSSHKTSIPNLLRSGNYKLTNEKINDKWPCIEYLLMYLPIIERIGGNARVWYQGLHWIYVDKDIDNKRMYKKVQERQSQLYKPADINSLLEQLNDIYNHGLRIKISIPTNRLNYIAEQKRQNIKNIGFK